MKYHLIVTLDYELFGDGSGCLDTCVVSPTEACRSAADKHGVPLTLFVEALEFVALSKRAKQITGSKYLNVEHQLLELVASGHKLQLHLHPQWLDAEPVDEVWKLDFRKWRVGDLCEDDLDRCFEAGLDYLTGLGASATAFRAGGWSIQPSVAILQQLKKRDIVIDSTVAPGLCNSAKGDWYDFKRAPSLPFWYIDEDVCSPDTEGVVVEVPIVTAHVGARAHARALMESRQESQFPEGCSGSYGGPNGRYQWLRGRISKMMNLGTVMLDYSSLPAWVLIEVTKQYMQRFRGAEVPVPIVAIGHNKNFSARSVTDFTTFLEWCRDNEQIVFSDYDTWLDAVFSTMRRAS